MCLDAAVMGTCPTFINQSWKRGERKKRKGKGKPCGGRRAVRGDAEQAGRGGGGERVLEGGGGTEQGSY